MEPSKPSAPLLLRREVGTGGALHIKWNVPADTGGVDIKEYHLYEVTVNGQRQLGKENYATKVNSFVVYNLRPLTTYYFQVKAINTHGFVGEISPTVAMKTTKVSPPGMASNIEVILASDELLVLRWDPPKDNGGNSIKTYELVMRSNEFKGKFITVYNQRGYESVTVSRNEFPGLYENTAYQLRVRAKNDAGFGKFTPIYSKLTLESYVHNIYI